MVQEMIMPGYAKPLLWRSCEYDLCSLLNYHGLRNYNGDRF